MQHLFGAHIVKVRFIKWRKYRGLQPAGPAGGGATLVVLVRCTMSCNGQLWRPGGISLSTFVPQDISGTMSIDIIKTIT